MKKKNVLTLIVLELVIIGLVLTLLSATLCGQIKPDSNYVVSGSMIDKCVEWKARAIFSEAKVDSLINHWPVVNRKEKWYYYGAGILTVIGIKYGIKLLR